MTERTSDFLGHEPCPSCGSKDNLARYSDGHGFCFGCNYFDPGDGEKGSTKATINPALISSTPQALEKRGLRQDTCAKYGYGVGTYRGKTVQVATYRDLTGKPVAQKIRTRDKQFSILGEGRDLPLYGMHLWAPNGKMVVVTEGEIDAMSVSQIQNNRWPVVSVPNGAQSAAKAVQRAIPWLETFETVIFLFDMDEPGKKAAVECASSLVPGKAKIAVIPLKDANEMLVAGRSKELMSAIWDARPFRPDGLVKGEELHDRVMEDEVNDSLPYPWMDLNEKTMGIRKGEIVTLTSGTGQGKSSVCRTWQHHLLKLNQTIGVVALEESVVKTARALMGVELRCPPQKWKEFSVTAEDKEAAFNATLGTGRVILYDHWGSLDSENLLSRIRYMVRGMGCTHVFLDHLSIVVSGIGDGDERRLIDNTMTRLRSLVEELKFSLFVVSHLSRPIGQGPSHEEGAPTALRQLRGSGAIGQLSDIVIGLERNQQDEDARDITRLRVLKNRWTGETGVSSTVRYDRVTGLLTETEWTDNAGATDSDFKGPAPF